MKTTIKYLVLLISISANAQLEQETTTYSYDNLNRLVQVVFNDNSKHDYVYDDLGNRTQLNITDSTLGIDSEVLQNTITVYPNPTESFLNVKLPDSFTSKNTSIQLYDVNGRLIVNNKPTIIDNQITINVNNLSKGVYLIHLITDNQKWSKLFIKK